jgi:hypothetical protein
LTLICESKNFKNRIKITNGIVNARNSLTSAYTNEFLSRSYDIVYRYRTDNVNVKIKKIEKKSFKYKDKGKTLKDNNSNSKWNKNRSVNNRM